MDENNNTNETGEQPTRENPFKDLKFYAAYFITIIISGVVSWLLGGRGNYWIIGILYLCIPYIIAGLIVWAILRNKNRAVALGILFGSITPFIAVFIGIGGCMMFMF